MLLRTRRGSPSLVRSVDDPEKIARGQVAALCKMPAVEIINDIRPLKRDENKRFSSYYTTALLESVYMEYDQR